MATATATATAVNQATTGTVFSGWALISISKIGESLVALERSHDSGSTWLPVAVFDENIEKNIYAPGSATQYRLKCIRYAQTTGVVMRIES